MVSTEHENAEYYFNRDVECIRTFFRYSTFPVRYLQQTITVSVLTNYLRRKFGFDSDEFPRLCEVKRRHTMDIELAASGFTKDMQKDLNRVNDDELMRLMKTSPLYRHMMKEISKLMRVMMRMKMMKRKREEMRMWKRRRAIWKLLRKKMKNMMRKKLIMRRKKEKKWLVIDRLVI